MDYFNVCKNNSNNNNNKNLNPLHVDVVLVHLHKFVGKKAAQSFNESDIQC